MIEIGIIEVKRVIELVHFVAFVAFELSPEQTFGMFICDRGGVCG